MALNIESAIERLLNNVKAAGCADTTIDLYRHTLKPLIKECGYSMDEPCDQSTIDNLLKKVEERYAEGKIVFGFYRFSKYQIHNGFLCFRFLCALAAFLLL